MKVAGIIFLVISILNFISIFTNSISGRSIGSPIYLIIVFVFFILGIWFLSKKKEKITQVH